jgi:hypothetical protein
MLKQLLLDELNRLTNTHEVIEEKMVYTESLRKVIKELTANRDSLARDFEIRQAQDELIAMKRKEGDDEEGDSEEEVYVKVYNSDDLVNFVLSELYGVVRFAMIWLLKTRLRSELSENLKMNDISSP